MTMRELDSTAAYVTPLFAAEDEALRAIRASAPARLSGMMLSAWEGALLSWLARLHGAKRIVEIGSFVGYSAAWLLRALPAEGELHAMEYEAAHAARFRANHAQALASGRLHLHEGAALDHLPTLPGLFDMVFIDADKANYPQYLTWAEAHLKSGGLVVVDNTLHFGSVDVAAEHDQGPGWQAVRATNARLADTAVWDAMLLPTAGGLTVARKR